MPDVRTEPESCCRCPDCADLSASSPPPPDLCSHFTAKHRESTVTLSLGEYVDVDVPGYICQYQHLDLSRIDEHVYHSLHGNSGPKDGPLAVKEQVNCWYDRITPGLLQPRTYFSFSHHFIILLLTFFFNLPCSQISPINLANKVLL